MDSVGRRVSHLLEEAVASAAIDDLNDRAVAVWVQEGIPLHMDAYQSDTCRFCGGALSSQRREALERHFNDTFRQFQRSVRGEVGHLEALRTKVQSLSLPKESQLYKHLRPEFSSAAAIVQASLRSLSDWLSNTIDDLKRKHEAPFERGTLTNTTLPDGAVLSAGLERLNGVIGKHNALSSSFELEVQAAAERLERCAVAEVYSHYAEKERAAGDAETAVADCGSMRRMLAERVALLERDIVEHVRPAEDLNRESASDRA